MLSSKTTTLLYISALITLHLNHVNSTTVTIHYSSIPIERSLVETAQKATRPFSTISDCAEFANGLGGNLAFRLESGVCSVAQPTSTVFAQWFHSEDPSRVRVFIESSRFKPGKEGGLQCF